MVYPSIGMPIPNGLMLRSQRLIILYEKDNSIIEYALKSAKEDRSITYQPKPTIILPGRKHKQRRHLK